MNQLAHPPPHRATVAVVGLGNIGSFVVELVGRLVGVARVLLVDRDVYEEKNLPSQKIASGDVGQAKAVVQARRLRRLHPELEVDAQVDDLARMPLGRLQADVIVAGLDSLAARLRVNEIAWRLGVTWVDAGVEPTQRLVRVNAYRPARGQPCLECALGESDYRQLPVRHPCQAGGSPPPETGAPANLGALAAALAVSECEKILAGDFARALVGRQLVLDALHHRFFVTACRRNPQCRFDHTAWRPAPLPRLEPTDSLRDLLAAVRRALGGDRAATVRLAGHRLVTTVHCLRCGHGVERLQVFGRITRRCPRCGGRELRASGFADLARLSPTLPVDVLRRSLASVGLRPGDVLQVQAGARERWFVMPANRM